MPGLLAVLLMSLDDRTKAAFDAAGETVKQLLALATASIGGMIALFDDGDAPGIDFGASAMWVNGALCLFGLSVVFGLFAMGTLAGQLGNDKITKPSTYAAAVLVMTIIQMGTFGLGVAAAVGATF